MSPVAIPSCKDDPKWKFNDQKGKNCGWVFKKSNCDKRGAEDNCKVACGPDSRNPCIALKNNAVGM